MIWRLVIIYQKGLKAQDIDEKTLILTMTEAHKTKFVIEYPNAFNVYTIKEYAGENGDVVDPMEEH